MSADPCSRCGGSGEVDGGPVTHCFPTEVWYALANGTPMARKAVVRLKPGRGGGNSPPPGDAYETIYLDPCPSCGGNVTISRRELEEMRGIVREGRRLVETLVTNTADAHYVATEAAVAPWLARADSALGDTIEEERRARAMKGGG